MKFDIRYRSKSDPLFLPWTMTVEDTKHPGVLTVQGPNPCEGDNLLGFERTFETMELTTYDDGWFAKCLGMSPVFASKDGSGFYSVQDYAVTGVYVHDSLPREDSPCTQ